MDIKSLVASALDLAETILPLVAPGASEAVIAAAKSAIGLIEKVKDGASGKQPELEEALEALQKRVEEHADSVISKLRGTHN